MKVVLYVHGKGGSASESRQYEDLFDCDVVGLDYDDYTPWVARDIILNKYQELETQYDEIELIANSIGAYFSMLALDGRNVQKAYFISPLVNMEQMIYDMMAWFNVTPDELEEKLEIPTNFGETLSWEYLIYVKSNSIDWKTNTSLLYGEKDNLVSIETIRTFANTHNATLTVMPEGEHWFHTPEQMRFLMEWMKSGVES